MSFENVKAQAIRARAEKDIGRKLDAIASALQELAAALAENLPKDGPVGKR